MAYCTAAQMLARYDRRQISKLLSDTGVQVTDANLPTNANLLAILEDASGMIAMAARVGKRYTALQLQAVADSTDDIVASQIIRLTADLAMGLIVLRRPGADPKKLAPNYYQAQEILEQLKRGERIFDVDLTDEFGSRFRNVIPDDADEFLLSQNVRIFGTYPLNLEL